MRSVPRVALRSTRGYRRAPRWGVLWLGVVEVWVPMVVGGDGLIALRSNPWHPERCYCVDGRSMLVLVMVLAKQKAAACQNQTLVQKKSSPKPR